MVFKKLKHYEIQHWLFHRLTAVVLFVTFYLEFFAKTGLFSFYNLVLSTCLIFVPFHFRFGIQTLIDDYQHDALLNIFCINLIRFSVLCSFKSLIYFQFLII